jgi:hypothetical protein
MTKIFHEEIEKLYNRLISGKKFAFSKYADGEWAIIKNEPIVARGEFEYNPMTDYYYSNKLLQSYQYQDDDYYIGISCPCCQGMETHTMMETVSQQKDDHITYANIFVNANYPYYIEKFVPYYATQKVILVCNRNGKVENLPFKPEKVYYIDATAFKTNYGLIEEMKKDVVDIKDHLFLFCAGPLGNMLAAELWQTNKENTYLDIGSTLNPWLQCEGHKRDYYNFKDLSNRVCTWGTK